MCKTAKLCKLHNFCTARGVQKCKQPRRLHVLHKPKRVPFHDLALRPSGVSTMIWASNKVSIAL